MSNANLPPVETLLREDAWRHHRSWLKRLAASLVVDAARADDVTQAALLAALERPPSDATQPRAWLATVARNLARRFAIGERRRAAREQVAALPERLPATDEVVGRAALQVEVSLAVLALEEPYRSVLLLRFFEDLPPRAIAKRLGIPVATARTRVLRGIEQLRERLITQRGADANGREPAPAILGLVALLDGTARRAVQKALLAKSAGSGAAIVGGSAVATLGLLGVIGMSTKLKLMVAAAVVACGTFAAVKLCEMPGAPPRDAAANATHGPPPLPAPATADAPPLPAPAAATRAPEVGDVAKPAEKETPAPAATTCAIEGIVRTARGDPAAGALVLLEDALHDARYTSIADLCTGAEGLLSSGVAAADASNSPGRVEQRTLAGSDGRFRFAAAPIGGSVNVAAIDRAEGVALVTGLAVDDAAATGNVELTLTAGVVLFGAVTGGQGEPLAGASVSVMRFSRVGGGTTSTSLLGVATDGDGQFRTLPLPFTGFRLSARADGYFRASQQAFPIAPDERERRFDFRLVRAPTWRGSIVTSDGAPARLADVKVRFAIVASSVDPRQELATPDSLGDLGTVAVAEARYELTPGEAGRRFLSVWGDQSLLGVAEITQPDVAPDVLIDLAKLPAPKASGPLALVVVDARSGAPITSYHVDLATDPLTFDDASAHQESQQVDDPAGRFALDALLAGNYDVTIRAAGYAPLFASVPVHGASASGVAAAVPVRLALKRADASVDGRVEDELGRAVAAAAVYLLNLDGSSALPSPEHRVLSDQEGRFTFPSVAAGDYLVIAARDDLAPPGSTVADGFAPASLPVKAIPASASPAGDAAAREAVVRLWRGFDVKFDTRCDGKLVMGPFSFRIRDERGAAVHDHHRPSSVTQMSGAGFQFRLTPGNYTVEVFSPQFAPSRTPFRAAPGATVVVELEPIGATVTGR